MSKDGLESVQDFIKDDLSGAATTETNVSSRASKCATLSVLTTDTVAMNDAHTFDALLYGSIGVGECCIICQIMAIVLVGT
jgi:hypothetical protein